MSTFAAKLTWERETADFAIKTYNRNHLIDFGNDNTIKASAAADYVGDVARVNPEQEFTAAVASCHMLTFLAVASQKGFVVDRYEDNAVGELGKNEQGKMAIVTIQLQPEITFSGERQPKPDELQAMHASAHKHCFIANSIHTQVKVMH